MSHKRSKRAKSGLRLWLWRGWCLLAVLLIAAVLFYLPAAANIKLFKGALRLLLLVGLATFIGTVFEIRNWVGLVTALFKPLIGFARLPQVVGGTMITALFSNYAASGMLAGLFDEGRITRFEMRVGAMCNSYVAYLSHSFRIMYPVIGALGLVGVYYFGLMFGAGLVITLTAVTACRFRPSAAISKSSAVLAAGDAVSDAAGSGYEKREPLTWRETMSKAWGRSREILLRVFWITVPLYVGARFLNELGVFQMWREFLPQVAAPFFPPEVLAIMMAQFGGLVSAAGVAFELHNHAGLSSAHILLALFAGNLVSFPLRVIRRNLPTAMGIFAPRDGFFIVMVMQMGRLLFVVLYIAVLITWLYLHQG